MISEEEKNAINKYQEKQELIEAICYIEKNKGNELKTHIWKDKVSIIGGFEDNKIEIDSNTEKPIRIETTEDDYYGYVSNWSIYVGNNLVCSFSGKSLWTYRPGKWENYLMNAVKKHKIAIEKIQLEEQTKYNERLKQQKIRQKKIENVRYKPIDDSKYFN